MKQIKKIQPKSLANISGAIYFLFGLVFGLIMFGLSLLPDMRGEQHMPFLFGFGGLFLLPLLYGAGGWLGGYVTAFVYNVVAKKVGGIKVELE